MGLSQEEAMRLDRVMPTVEGELPAKVSASHATTKESRGRFRHPLLPSHCIDVKECERQVQHRIVVPYTAVRSPFSISPHSHGPFIQLIAEAYEKQDKIVLFRVHPDNDPMLPCHSGSTSMVNLPALLRASVEGWKMPFTMLKADSTYEQVSPRSFLPSEGDPDGLYTGVTPPSIDDQLQMLATTKPSNLYTTYAKDAEYNGIDIFDVTHIPKKSHHPFDQDAFRNAPGNLFRLLDRAYAPKGLVTSYGYPAGGSSNPPVSQFNLHAEQLYSPFWHHCMAGSKRWFLVPRKFRARALEVMIDFIIDHQKLPRDLAPELRPTLLAFFRSKSVFIPPAYLRDRGIDVVEVTLRAGEILMASGDWLHEGLNETALSFGAAINLLPESWLTDGPTMVRDLLMWYETCWDAGLRDRLKNTIGKTKVLLINHLNRWGTIMNQVAVSFSCPLLAAIRDDIAKHLWVCSIGGLPVLQLLAEKEFSVDTPSRERLDRSLKKTHNDRLRIDKWIASRQPQFEYSLPDDVLFSALVHLIECLHLLHTKSMRSRFVLVSQTLCPCSDDSPGGLAGQATKIEPEVAVIIEIAFQQMCHDVRSAGGPGPIALSLLNESAAESM